MLTNLGFGTFPTLAKGKLLFVLEFNKFDPIRLIP